MTSAELTSSRHWFAGWEEAQEHYFEGGLTDGLPVVPPTEDRVRAMLQHAGLPPHHVIGYPNPNRSHSRSMDIWHTCEPDQVGTEDWLGRVIRDLDPEAENLLT